MLIDIRLIADHIVPALIISAVFMVGKIVANTVGTFIAGQGGRTSLRVGMGMPQIGEFSLAMTKIGAEQEAIRALLYQVVAGVTAITSLAYPYIARSADGAAVLLERRAPQWLRRSVANLSGALQTFRNSLTFDSEFAHRIRSAAVPIAINFLIIVVLIATGTFLARSGDPIAATLGFHRGIIGTIIGLGTLTLCIPSAIAIWRGLRRLTDEVTSHYPIRRRFPALASQQRLRNVLRDAILMMLVFVIALWSIPLVVQILSLGSLAVPVALAIIATIGFIALRVLTHMHQQLVTIFSETFVGSSGQATSTGAPSDRPPSAYSGPESGHPTEQEQSAVSHGAVPPIVDGGPYTEATAGPVSLGDAEMIALSTVSRDRSPYHNRHKAHQLAWDIASATEELGNYRITLTFREADSDNNETGEEEIYIDQRGNVRLRQITSWPPGSTKSVFRLVSYTGALLVVILGVGAGVLAFLLWGPQ
jgi:hypothetical protein